MDQMKQRFPSLYQIKGREEVSQQKQEGKNMHLLYCTVSPRFSWHENHSRRPDKPGRVMYTNIGIKRVKHRVFTTQPQLRVVAAKRKD